MASERGDLRARTADLRVAGTASLPRPCRSALPGPIGGGTPIAGHPFSGADDAAVELADHDRGRPGLSVRSVGPGRLRVRGDVVGPEEPAVLAGMLHGDEEGLLIGRELRSAGLRAGGNAEELAHLAAVRSGGGHCVEGVVEADGVWRAVGGDPHHAVGGERHVVRRADRADLTGEAGEVGVGPAGYVLQCRDLLAARPRVAGEHEDVPAELH